jgi:hypothetical protein
MLETIAAKGGDIALKKKKKRKYDILKQSLKLSV